MQSTTSIHVAIDWPLESSVERSDPFAQCRVEAVFNDARGRRCRVPAFWAGGGRWVARVSFDSPGEYELRSECSDPCDKGLHAQRLVVEAKPPNPRESNPLLRHGPLRLSDDGRRLVHHDGTRFFWFGDTWWMQMSDRVAFPDDFARLADDRQRHGVNVIQTVVGWPGDCTPFVDRTGDNEGGPPWEPGYARLNPRHFDQVDARLSALIRRGITPCILGSWGYHMLFMGQARMELHWRYLVARYAGWPVIFCLAGETTMPYYRTTNDPESDQASLQSAWSRIAAIVRQSDPYARPLTTHPRQGSWNELDDPGVLDFHMTQCGHMPLSVAGGIRLLEAGRERFPHRPLIAAEPPYEGHGGTNGPDVQRMSFWTSVLSGADGYTYGAAGIFQANDRLRRPGPRPDGAAFDRWTWDEALNFVGIGQIARGVALLHSLPFERFEVHQEWADIPLRWGHDNYRPPIRAYAAGVPGECRLIYLPLRWYHWEGPTIKSIEPGVSYRISYIDPATFDAHDAGVARGEWTGPVLPYLHDWLVLMRKDAGG
jgi:hypothetical protein